MTTKILIIDDDKFTRQILRKILERDQQTAKFDPEVLVASNGVEGVALFEQERPHLVIVDLFMPKMDGFAVCKRLRELADKSELTIAITSGVYKDAAISKQVELDYDAHFFAKPYQLKNIASFAAKALGPFAAVQAPPSDTKITDGLARSGDLSTHKVPALFWDVLEHEATGRLILRRGQVVRQIELFVGHPVSVTTNVREETLGQFLLTRGIIDQATHREAMASAAKSKKRLGETLIAIGALTSQQLITELTAQTRLKLVHALRWSDGSWDFNPSEARGHRANALDFAQVIISGLASTARIDPLAPEIAALEGQPLTLTERGQRILPLLASASYSSFASAFRQGTTTEQLGRAGVNRLELHTCLEVLHSCKGIDLQAIKLNAGSVAASVNGPLDLSLLADSAQRRPAASELFASLFESEAAAFTHTGAHPLAKLGDLDLGLESSETSSEAASPADSHAESDSEIDAFDAALQRATSPAGGPAREPGLEPDAAPAKASTSPARPAKAAEAAKNPATPATTATAPTDRRAAGSNSAGADDQNFDEDSVVNVSFSNIPKNRQRQSLQEELLTEFLRIQEKSYYEILEVRAEASSEVIKEAHREHCKRFSKTRFDAETMGRDYQKLDVLLNAYDQAQSTLCDEITRQHYDDSLFAATGGLVGAPSLDAELAFREAEDMVARGDTQQAIAKLEATVAIAPYEAAYRATLGWILFVHHGENSKAAEHAGPHLNAALSLAPDDALVHEYMGRMHATIGDDIDAAIMHLDRALEHEPRRGDALLALEKLHLARGEVSELEQLYRRLIFRLNGSPGGEEAIIWSRLGDLHAHFTHDHASALIAYERALRMSPQNASLQAKCAQLRSGGSAPFYEEARSLIRSWQNNPAFLEPLHTLLAKAGQAELPDSCFVTASALHAAGDDDENCKAWYERYRPRFLARAQAPLDTKLWGELLHPEDLPAVGSLYALLEPILYAGAIPVEAQNELDKAEALKESALTADFLSVRNYLAHVLEVPAPEVRARADYQRMISVPTIAQPVILAGYDILTCTDKLELCFRLGRAMSFLRPGRSAAAGTPARTLKSAMLACYSLAAPRANIPDPDGNLRQFIAALSECDEAVRAQLQELVLRISKDHPTLNLSRWSRVLPRTAERVGLLLCGDIPTAARICSELAGPGATSELLAFSVSPEHLQIRRALGLSIDV